MQIYFKMSFLWGKAEFSASLLQSSVPHDPSEIILTWWNTFLLLVENSCAAECLCGNCDIYL